MGLGKTLQALIGVALGHDKYGHNNYPRSIVVCPATIVSHWVSEIRRFFPGDRAVLTPDAVIGDSAKRTKFWSTFAESKVNIVVVSYSTMRSDISHIAKTKWIYCILDEGHVLRNPKTATAAASRLIPSRHRLVLSGTMIQNKVLDVWATFDFLMPNFLGSSKEFTEKYARPITKSQLHGACAERIREGMEKLRILHQQVLPFILRREKEQVLRELPPKTITNLKCQMSVVQRRLYSAFSESKEGKECLALFHRQSDLNEDQLGAKTLRILLFLRLICTHPSLIDRKLQNGGQRGKEDAHYNLSSSGKFSALFDLLRDSGVNSDSFFAGDQDESLVYLDSPEEETSSKLEETGISLEYDDAPLGTLRFPANGSQKPKCLVFAQFSQTLDAIENYLFKPHMPSLRYLRLDGSVPPENRVDIAERFNSDSSISVLLLTTRVGSLGLNLTGASIVIFVEHDFNPFVDEQAMDRVHRIGQKADSVNVYRLIASDSIDEKIMEVQTKKVATSRAVVNTENSTLYSLGTDRLLDIFSADTATSDDETLQDLDALLSSCAKDYESLSVDEFIKSFVSRA
jgi:TATA-binding protein-associated factor